MKTAVISGSLSGAAHLFANQNKTVSRYQQETYKLSEYQKKLFSICLKGYEAFTSQERAKLTYNDRKLVEKSFGVTRRVMNEMKQRKITGTISCLFNKLFPNARGQGLSFLMYPVQDKTYTTHVSMKELGIRKEELIIRLIEESVLPSNFLTLNKAA